MAAAHGDSERHHRGFADGVDGRVGDLGEPLLEVGGEGARLAGEDGDGGIVAHGADRLVAFAHGGEDELELFGAVAGGLLPGAELVGGGREEVGVGRGGELVERDEVVCDPVAVGLCGSEFLLELSVVEQSAGGEVDGDHLARAKAAPFDDLVVVDGEHADLGGEEEAAVAGNEVAGGAEAVAVERCGGDLAIGEDDGGGSVPGLIHAEVEVAEGLEVGVDVGVGGVGLWDQHGHGEQGRAAREGEELEGVVEVGGVAAALEEHLADEGGVEAPGRVAEFGGAGARPDAVAGDGVDLAVVGEHAEGVGERPGGEGVGAVALVEDGEAGDERRVAEVGVEVAERVRGEEPLVDDGAAGEADDVEVAELRRGRAGLDLLAGGVELAVEFAGSEVAVAGDQELLGDRHAGGAGDAEDGGVDGDFAPEEAVETAPLEHLADEAA